MDTKILQWLRSRVPEWEANGWLSEEGAREIRNRYLAAPITKGPSMTRLLVLAMGSILVGMGIFLLFAGYWYGFSPNGRFDWSLVIVVLSLLVLGIAVGHAKRGGALAEGATLLFMGALSVSTFLMADTYYTGEAVGIYVLMVLMLSLPVIYIMESGIGMIVYLLGALVWSVSSHAVAVHAEPIVLWGLLALGVPFYWHTIQRYKERHFLLLWLSWAYMAAALGALFFVIESYNLSLALVLVGAFANGTFAMGSLSRSKGIWTLPFRGIGALGLLYVVVCGTLLSTWQTEAVITPGWFTGLLAVVGLGATLYLEQRLLQARLVTESIIGLCPLVLAGISGAVHGGVSPFMASAIFNVYIIFLAIIMCIRGTVEKRVGLFNGCVVMCIAMMGARFFDPAFTFVERGIVFLLVGLAVFGINAFYMWRKHLQVQQGNRQTNRQTNRQANLQTNRIGTDGKEKTLPQREADDNTSSVVPLRMTKGEGHRMLREPKREESEVTKGGEDHEV